MDKWIDCKEKLPMHKKEVEVIFVIYDPNKEWDVHHSYQRHIGTGKFYPNCGWEVRNGYIVNLMPIGPTSNYLRWQSVLYWREMDESTLYLFNQRLND